MCDSFATRAFFLKYDSSVSNIYKAVIYHAYQTVCFAVTPFIYSSFYTPRAPRCVHIHHHCYLIGCDACLKQPSLSVVRRNDKYIYASCHLRFRA